MPQPDSISILVVDDDPAVLESFRIMLEREPGYEVETTTASTDVLTLLDERHFDVILSDFFMPDLDGITLLREARARGCQSLFVIITGKRLAHIAMDALNSGADFYIQKGADTAKEFPRLIEFINTTVPKKAAETEILAWERFYHSVVEEAPDLICRMLPDGSLTYANESCLHFFKKTYNELLNGNFFSRIPDSEKITVLSLLRNLSAMNPDTLIEHHIRTEEGRARTLQWHYHGFFSENGALSDYQVSGRATEGIVRIDSAGSTAPVPAAATVPGAVEDYDWNQLADTIQSLENPVFAIDRNGRVIAWNRAIGELTGINAAQMLGKGDQEYAVPFYGKPAPMLVDHIFLPPDSPAAAMPGIKKVGDTYIGEMDRVTIRGKPMLLWGKGSPVFDGKGNLIAAIEVITVGEPEKRTGGSGTEKYLGGVSSITLKVSGVGVGGAIAGAIGSSTGGYGVYATDQRIFVIRNPDPGAGQSRGVQFGFIMDELFGITVDTRPKPIQELEKLKVFEVYRKDLVAIDLKKPVLLSGYLTFTVEKGGTFRVYIDHKKSFTQIEELVQSFCPEKIRRE